MATEDDLTADEANARAVQLFGTGSLVESLPDGFIVWRPPLPPSDTTATPEGMALPSREVIGKGPTRRAALESARHALHR